MPAVHSKLATRPKPAKEPELQGATIVVKRNGEEFILKTDKPCSMAEAARQSRCFTDAVDLCLLLADGVAKGNLYCDFSMKAARPMLKHKGDEEECLMFLHLKDLLTARGLPPTTFGYDLDKDGNIPNDDIVHIYFAKA